MLIKNAALVLLLGGAGLLIARADAGDGAADPNPPRYALAPSRCSPSIRTSWAGA
jgi:hypothetical protein